MEDTCRCVCNQVGLVYKQKEKADETLLCVGGGACRKGLTAEAAYMQGQDLHMHAGPVLSARTGHYPLTMFSSTITSC